MRVITGLAGGRKLVTLDGEDVTRPTKQSTKEALFSSIQFELEGKRILDLFAGSGQLGIEALSRGALFCTFVENNRKAYAVVEENIKKCSFEGRSRIVFSDAVSFLRSDGEYDIVFADPPYGKGIVEKILPLVVKKVSDGGVIVCETGIDEKLTVSIDDWKISKEKKYGKTKLTYYRKDIK